MTEEEMKTQPHKMRGHYLLFEMKNKNILCGYPQIQESEYPDKS